MLGWFSYKLSILTEDKNPALLALLGLIGATLWTLVGALIAALAGSLSNFWQLWFQIQGFVDVTAALSLGLVARSSALWSLISGLQSPPVRNPKSYIPAWVRAMRGWVQAFVFLVGFASTTHLGFPASPPVLYFMWATCFLVCLLAAFITWHAVELLAAAWALGKLRIDFFVYAPGETRSLRRLAGYFAAFGFAMTVAYIFSLVGTLLPSWRGPDSFIRFVQLLWPSVYVPLCLALTTYPHLAIHELIATKKEQLIADYHAQINRLLTENTFPSEADIDHVNALADLAERVRKSPGFALSIPTTITTLSTYALNIGSLVVPREMVEQVLRSLLWEP